MYQNWLLLKSWNPMTVSRHQKIFLLKQQILHVAEQLLLENNQDIVVGELAAELDIAKGTIYKYFKCKNQLYLELLILNETRLLDIAQNFKTDVQEGIRQFMLYHLTKALLHKDLKCKAPLIEPNLRRNLGKWST